MGLNIKNRDVEELAAEVAQMARETKTEAIRRALLERKARLKARLGSPRKSLLDWLEQEVWPTIPETALGNRVTKRERERILGYGKFGV